MRSRFFWYLYRILGGRIYVDGEEVRTHEHFVRLLDGDPEAWG